MRDKYKGLKERVTNFALRIIKMYGALPKNRTDAQVLGKQVLRSGTSVGAHYREATRARSDREFISKMEGGLQELEETAYWLELLVGANIVTSHKMSELIKETDELTAMFTAAVIKVKKRMKSKG